MLFQKRGNATYRRGKEKKRDLCKNDSRAGVISRPGALTLSDFIVKFNLFNSPIFSDTVFWATPVNECYRSPGPPRSLGFGSQSVGYCQLAPRHGKVASMTTQGIQGRGSGW